MKHTANTIMTSFVEDAARVLEGYDRIIARNMELSRFCKYYEKTQWFGLQIHGMKEPTLVYFLFMELCRTYCIELEFHQPQTSKHTDMVMWLDEPDVEKVTAGAIPDISLEFKWFDPKKDGSFSDKAIYMLQEDFKKLRDYSSSKNNYLIHIMFATDGGYTKKRLNAEIAQRFDGRTLKSGKPVVQHLTRFDIHHQQPDTPLDYGYVVCWKM